MEKEKHDFSFCMEALKDPQKEPSYILEKIFYEQSQIFRAFHELYQCCSKEMTENYKKRLQADLEENSQRTIVSLKRISNEIKKTFLQKIITQKLTFTIKGKDIPMKAQKESSVYFILYFLLKKTMKRIPKKGKIEILLKLSDLNPKIVIRDTGFLLSEEKMKKLPSFGFHKSIEFPEDPSFEDITQVSQMCGWTILPMKKEGIFNVTEISLRQHEERRVYKNSNILYLKKPEGSLFPV